LGVLGLLAFLAPLRQEEFRPVLLMKIAISLAVILTCVADSKYLSKPMPRWAKWVMFLTWPVASCVYLVWTRGWKRGILLFLACLLCLVLLTAMGFVVFEHPSAFLKGTP